MSNYLRVDSIHKTFRLGTKELHILRGVSFEVSQGEMVAITGHSGSGKTTLLHIVGALDKPDSGDVVYGDRNVASLGNGEMDRFRNQEIGFVFQFFQLLPEFSALENAMMPLLIAGQGGASARKRAEEVLGEVGLGERLHHYPNQLSGGEQQRAAIARALVRQPKVLLADEPTGNLDVATGERVFAMLRKLQQRHGLVSVIVTHNPVIAEQCDRVLALETLNEL